MPSKDREVRMAVSKAWRERNHTPEYMRWLGQRRALHREVAAIHEEALLLIARTSANENASAWAEEALQLAHQKRVELGNRFDHERNEPYWKDS